METMNQSINQKRVIINQNENMIMRAKRALDRDQRELNQILESFKALGLAFDISIENIFDFIRNQDSFVESFIRKGIVGATEEISIGGLKLDREKLAGQIDIPELSDLLNAIGVIRTRFNSSDPSNKPFAAKFFQLNGGAVRVNTTVTDAWMDSNYRFYITEEEHEALNKAIENLDLLCEKYGGDSRHAIVSFTPKNNGCYLNEKFFKINDNMIR